MKVNDSLASVGGASYRDVGVNDFFIIFSTLNDTAADVTGAGVEKVINRYYSFFEYFHSYICICILCLSKSKRQKSGSGHSGPSGLLGLLYVANSSANALPSSLVKRADICFGRSLQPSFTW